MHKPTDPATPFPWEAYHKLARQHPYLEREKAMSLLEGDAGLGLSMIHAALASGNEELPEAASLFLERYLDFDHFSNLPPNFGYGTFGLAWVMAYLSNIRLLELEEEAWESLDGLIRRQGLQCFQQGNYDLWYGGIGAAAYFLERGKGEAFFEQAVGLLKASAVQESKGLYWPSFLMKEKTGRKAVDFGLAHGLASIIVFLAKVYEAGASQEDCRSLIDGALHFMSLHADERAALNKVPDMAFPNDHGLAPSFGNRLAFCYGDLGVSLAYQKVAAALGYNELQERAVNMALDTVQRKNKPATGIEDGGLCHGCFGAAYLYRKWYEEVPENAFREAAVYWLQAGYAYINKYGGIGNFKSKENLSANWRIDYSLLTGASGAALADLSINNGMQWSGWDRVLFLT